MVKFSIKDVDDNFYDKIIQYFKECYRFDLKQKMMFNQDLSYKLTSVNRYNPATGKTEEFPFPLAYDIRVIYHFVVNDYDVAEDIEESIYKVTKLIHTNPWTKKTYYDMTHDKFTNLRIGFLIYLAELKLRLLQGENFAAVELGTMIGITGQGIVNRIKRGQLNAKKEGNSWVIKNKDAKRIVKEESIGLI